MFKVTNVVGYILSKQANSMTTYPMTMEARNAGVGSAFEIFCRVHLLFWWFIRGMVEILTILIKEVTVI